MAAILAGRTCQRLMLQALAVRLRRCQWEHWGMDGSDSVRSAAEPLQMCSPIIEISIWRLHDEHFTVGINVDSRGTAILV